MKQTILKSLMLIAVLLTSNAVCAYDFESGGIYYNILSDTDKTVSVTYKDINNNSYTGEVAIPSTVTLGENTYSVTYIGKKAFERCSSLTSVTIERSVTIIGNYAFAGCENLGIVISLNTTPPSCGSSVFDTSTTANAYLIVPQENVSMYEIYPTWKDFTNIIGKDLSGVEDMLVDDNNAPAEYYNLNGVRVQYPKNGVYIKRKGNKITKVVVK